MNRHWGQFLHKIHCCVLIWFGLPSVLCSSCFSFFSLFCGYICTERWIVGSLMSDSLQPHGLQQARLPCPSPTPRACTNSCPSIQWCHPTISSSIIPLSSFFQSFPALVSFIWSQLGEGSGTPLQYSCLENPMDGGAWWAAIYGAAQNQTQVKQLSSSSSVESVLRDCICCE